MLQIIIAFLELIGQTAVLWMSYKMARFAAQYGDRWALAFYVFTISMALTLGRVIGVIMWAFGIDGNLGKFMQLVDHVFLTAGNVILYLLFLWLLRGWWKEFFGRYFPNGFQKKDK